MSDRNLPPSQDRIPDLLQDGSLLVPPPGISEDRARKLVTTV